jgi:hypothetical protein
MPYTLVNHDTILEESAASVFRTEDGSSRLPQNVGIEAPDYMVSYPR